MYEEYFGLNRRPFSPIPSAEDFVSVPHLQEALDALVNCVTQARGIAVISAAAGMGKSTLTKKLAALMRPHARSVFLNGAGIENRRGLLQALLFELGGEYVGLSEQEARLKLLEICRRSESQGSPSKGPRHLMVIIEDAHLLPEPVFEELRTLGDYAPEGERLIQLVVCGPFELEEKLTDPALASFSQRIGVQVHLTPLCRTESAQFIADRLLASGGSSLSAMIDGPALDLICLASDGNLRCLSQLTDHALLLTFAMNRPRVDEGIVRTALDDLKELPLRWNEIPPPSNPGPMTEIEEEDDLPEFWSGEESDQDDLAERESDEFTFPEAQSHESLPPESLSTDTTYLTSGPADQTTDSSVAESQRPNTETESPPAVTLTEETPEFFVYEVGAEEETPPPADASAENATLETDSTTADEIAWSMHTGPKPFETEMQETLLVDRYTLLDRYFELPEERRSRFDLSALADLPPETGYSFSTSQDDAEPPDAVIYPELLEARSELEVLESIRKLRREVADQLKDSLNAPYPTRSAHFDVVEPEPDPRVSIPFLEQQQPQPTPERPAEPRPEPVAAVRQPETSPAPERRFAQLFSRLRSRKQRIESKHPGQ